MAEEFFIPTQYHDTLHDTARAVARPTAGQTYQSHSYYRSHFFSVNMASCPLMQAAMPLLIILSRLAEEAQTLAPSALQEKLIHEINAFSSQVQTYAYPFETLILSRYILAISFDHFITSLGIQSAEAWQEFLLVNMLQHDHFGGAAYDVNFSHIENIIKISEKLLEKPQEHDDLLELIFLCLTFGFEGDAILGVLLIDAEEIPYTAHMLIEKIYPILEKKRAQLPALLNQVTSSPITLVTRKKKNIIPRGFIITFCATAGALVGCYVLLNHIFHLVLQPLFQQLNSLS